jgi:purine-binding chemotaxis protein CheW
VRSEKKENFQEEHVMTLESIVEGTQFLTFKLGKELFAVDIEKVQEVLDYTTITKVPWTPDYLLGVINLRGSVVPVVDMRTKFAMVPTERTVNTCFVIVEVDLDGGKFVIGAMADAVQEVLDLEPDQIEPPPRIGAKMDITFIRGMGKHNDQFIIILDIDRIFSSSDMAVLAQAAKPATECETIYTNTAQPTC